MKKPVVQRRLPIAPAAVLRDLEESLLRDMEAAPRSKDAGRLDAAIVNACDRMEEVTSQMKELVPPDQAIACGARCPWCCHVKVNVSAPEVLRIADHVRANKTPQEQAEILARVVATDTQTRGKTIMERAAVPLPCPLLEHDNCSVHAVRPFACRGANSFDASACKRAVTERAPQMLAAYAPQLRIASIARAAITFGGAAGGIDARPLELNAAMRIALERPNARERWSNGLPVFSQAIDEEAHQQILQTLAQRQGWS
jgi:hypothetical protein